MTALSIDIKKLVTSRMKITYGIKASSKARAVFKDVTMFLG